MKFKFFALSFICSLTFSRISFAEEFERNLCDDIIESGTASSENIQDCFKKFKPSDYYLNQEKMDKYKKATAADVAVLNAKNKDNLEIKIFSTDELFKAGFGKPFFATKTNYKKEKRITTGDALCSYLGFEKVISSEISEDEIWEGKKVKGKDEIIKVDKQGLIIDTSFLGIISKVPEVYRDEAAKYAVRKYEKITCVKRKNKDLEGSDSSIKNIVEQLKRGSSSTELSAKSDESEDKAISNGPRKGKDKKSIGSTPESYVPPTESSSTGK
jgi:hypothetical protein